MNIKSYLSLLFLTLVSLFLITAKASGQTWTTEVVDSSGDVGRHTSIALDTSDNAHISYIDFTNRELKYATNTTGSWVTETVDSSGSAGFFYTSIAIDTSDNAHISYFDDTNDDLKYTTGQGSTGPPVPVSSPVPDIKVNGSDGPVTPTGNLSVTVALDPGSRSGENADWWVAANVSGTSIIDGWYYFDLSAFGFVPAGASPSNLLVTLQGQLSNLPTVGIFDIPVSAIPSGTYTFYFAVDMTMNGLLDGELFFDFVVVNIE